MDFFKLVAPVYDTAMKITGHNKTLAELVEATGDALPLADNSFDHVTIADVLHHFNNIEKTFVEIKRVLKPGG